MLPVPLLRERAFGRLHVLTDDRLAEALGVRIAFTTRNGGSSQGPFAGLNLGGQVGDDPAAVAANRQLLVEELEAASCELFVPKQVHGTTLVTLDSRRPEELARARKAAEAGADGFIVTVSRCAALLCFADCLPLIIVAPDGSFAVVHAGWRGAVARIASKAALALVNASGRSTPAELSAYIGPHIRSECFEVSADVAQRFADTFGSKCLPRSRHVDLFEAVASDLSSVGVLRERIADAGICTMCNQERFFSHRGSGGCCGRQGAFALRREREEG